MWKFDTDLRKWKSYKDELVQPDFDFYKQQLQSVRFWSKCLSGATYLPVNDINNIYDILGKQNPSSWYISIGGSSFSNTLIPSQFPNAITATTSYDFYTKSLSEYGLTLKTHYTPHRLIKESAKNYIEVDVATTVQLDLTQNPVVIDGVTLLPGHKVLVKDQKSTIVLLNTEDPDSFLVGNYTVFEELGATIEYQYFDNTNGIYEFDGNLLVKTNDLDDYNNCVRLSILIKLGLENVEKQFHLQRLRNGFFPTSDNDEPMEFIQKKNWILRNRIDYNNLFEINYFDVHKHSTQSYFLDGITYSIPERNIAVGEFGVILNTQFGRSNIIHNKYKVNLRSISQTSKFYWICGDEGVLLRLRKHDLYIDRIEADCLCPRNLVTTDLYCIHFFNDLKGVAVGELNTILVTKDGGFNWQRLRISDFDSFTFTQCIYMTQNSFVVAGTNGIFIEFTESINGWSAVRKRISRFIDDDDEYVLVDKINQIFKTSINSWGLSYSFSTQSTSSPKELLFIVADDSKIITYDLNDSVPGNSFFYIEFPSKYGDIKSMVRRYGTNTFYFGGKDPDTDTENIYSFDITNHSSIGVGNSYSNTILGITPSLEYSDVSVNKIFDYNSTEIFICGNNSLLLGSTYSNLDFKVLDNKFESKLKSKMLFLDYDIGSKLSFFTDTGEYRLPNEITFGATAGDTIVNHPASNFYFSFEQIIYGATSPSFATQSENNWISYWQDSTKTFEYYVDLPFLPLDETTKVVISNSFSFTSMTSSLLITTMSVATWSIANLAPTIVNPTSSMTSKFSGIGQTPITAPTASYDLYLCDYMTIVRFSVGSFAVNVGDVINFQSAIVESNLIVNKIVSFSGYNYVYMFNDFNQQMITALSGSTYSITITNLNKFNNIAQIEERFLIHPISQAYKLTTGTKQSVTRLVMDFGNGGLTSSYNNWTFVGSFTESTPFSSPTTSSPYSITTATAGDFVIETPYVMNVENISFSYVSNNSTYTPATFSYINVQGFSGSSWYDINTYTISDGVSGLLSNTVNISLTYNYEKFRFNIKASSATPTNKIVTIDDINFTSSIDLSIDISSYGTGSGTVSAITIQPRYNNLTAYYNLATNINTSLSTYTMSYTDGFIKFGYTPTYNILDYLEALNDKESVNPKFYADREFYAMPEYLGLPLPGVLSFQQNQLYVDYNGLTYSNITGNQIYFGLGRKLEFDSFLINTFVDVLLYGTTSYGSGPIYTSERLLITSKYYDSVNQYYVMEFHKGLNFLLNSPLYWIDIKSRRKLSQISYDLQELNNIQRERFRTREVFVGSEFINFERELNYKIPTDSYAKILLSDFDIVNQLSCINYVDFKNEICLNVTNLGKDYEVPIINTANFGGKLFISCLQKHELADGDGVVLEFNGGTGSSQTLNQQYFGYFPVNIISDYNFTIDLPYGNIPLTGIDSGIVRYSKRDPFLNFQPVDIIDLGIDKKGKQSVELKIENIREDNNRYSLVNVDFSKYRFRMVDGLNIETLSQRYPWILEAEISGAILGENGGGLVWYNGTWECGRWFGGTWISGSWISGDWYDGLWRSLKINDLILSVEIDSNSNSSLNSTWFSGRWYGGTWENGLWVDGRWYGGRWNDGIWYNGIWNDGNWFNGLFTGGVWVKGEWQNGIFNCDNNPSYWLDGNWYGGDFENGMWYNGTFDQRDPLNQRTINIKRSRFGTKAYNSRTATWHGGKWINGSFYSFLNTNDQGRDDVSDVHKLSIWYTGQWLSGNWYGGVAYNIDFKSGTWYGGILDDIQIIGINSSENYFVLNGIFKFNIGDEITITDNRLGSPYGNTYGSIFNPRRYKVLYTVEDRVNKWTNVYVATDLVDDILPPTYLGLWVVSRFKNSNWKSGIWTNGVFEDGLWEGGIWYNGIFEQNATWL